MGTRKPWEARLAHAATNKKNPCLKQSGRWGKLRCSSDLHMHNAHSCPVIHTNKHAHTCSHKILSLSPSLSHTHTPILKSRNKDSDSQVPLQRLSLPAYQYSDLFILMSPGWLIPLKIAYCTSLCSAGAETLWVSETRVCVCCHSDLVSFKDDTFPYF